MRTCLSKDYIITMTRKIKKNLNKKDKVYITKRNEIDIILVTQGIIKDKRAVNITSAVLDFADGNCNLAELNEYIWNRYQAWEYKNIAKVTEVKKRPGLRMNVEKEYPNYQEMLDLLGISWVGFKSRVERGMSYKEALTTPKIQPGWKKVKKNNE